VRNIYFTICCFWFLAIDIVSKVIVERVLSSEIPLINGVISLEKVYNSGIAFSIHIPLLLLQILTLVLIFWIISYYFYDRKWSLFGWYDLGFSLIVGWAIWNAIWRIWYWYVVDFISVSYFSVFNVADIFISIGACVLIAWYWKTAP